MERLNNQFLGRPDARATPRKSATFGRFRASGQIHSKPVLPLACRHRQPIWPWRPAPSCRPPSNFPRTPRAALASMFSLRACCLQTEARSCHRTRRVRSRGSDSRACRALVRERREPPALHRIAGHTLSRAGYVGRVYRATRTHQRQTKPQELQKAAVRRGARGTSGAPARTSNEYTRKVRGYR